MNITPDQAAWLVQLGAIALVGFLLKRAINNLDDSIRDVKASLKALDTTDRDQGKAILELTIQAKFLLEKIHELEDRGQRFGDRLEEFGRFMSRELGFRRSDPPKGGE